MRVRVEHINMAGQRVSSEGVEHAAFKEQGLRAQGKPAQDSCLCADRIHEIEQCIQLLPDQVLTLRCSIRHDCVALES